MAFSYEGTADGTITTDLSRVRLEIGDTDPEAILFQDQEINSKLQTNTTVLSCAAALCDILSRKFARAFDFTTDGQQFYRSQQSKAYKQLATELRQRDEGVEVDSTHRVDGYSDDIPYDATSTTSNRRGRVRAGWYDPDLPS